MKKLIVAVVGLAVFAPGAFAASSHFLKVSPSKVGPGPDRHRVRLGRSRLPDRAQG